MPITVKKIVLWRTEVENQPGALAGVVGPPAKAGADLKVIMGYHHPAARGKAAIEVFPIAGKKLKEAAATAGLHEAPIPALLVEGDNRPGLGFSIAEKVAAAGINIAFLMAHVIGGKFAAVFGFESDGDAANAVPLIRKAGKEARA